MITVQENLGKIYIFFQQIGQEKWKLKTGYFDHFLENSVGMASWW